MQKVFKDKIIYFDQNHFDRKFLFEMILPNWKTSNSSICSKDLNSCKFLENVPTFEKLISNEKSGINFSSKNSMNNDFARSAEGQNIEYGEILNPPNFSQTQNFSPLIKGEIERNSEYGVEIIYMKDLLEKFRNNSLEEKLKIHPAMWQNIYSPKDELNIFTELFEESIKTGKKIHIVGVTLGEEIEILEKYYFDLGFFSEELNCFETDFSVPLVTVSVNIENLMWRGSDYKANKEKIFFNPPIREAGQTKAMFKGINRGMISGIYISEFSPEIKTFLENCIKEEHILATTLAGVLSENLESIGIIGEKEDLVLEY